MAAVFGDWQSECFDFAVQQFRFAHQQIDRAVDPGDGGLVAVDHLLDGFDGSQHLIRACRLFIGGRAICSTIRVSSSIASAMYFETCACPPVARRTCLVNSLMCIARSPI